MRPSFKTPNPNQDSGWNWIEKYGWVAAILSVFISALEKSFPESISKPAFAVITLFCIFVSFYWSFKGFLLAWISQFLSSEMAALACAGIATVYVYTFTTLNSNQVPNNKGSSNTIIQTPSPSPSTNPGDSIKIPTPILSPSIQPVPEEPRALNFKQAGDLVWEYLELKKEIFTPPYNEARLNKFTGGKLYEETRYEIEYVKKNNISFGYKHKLFEQLEDKFSCLQDTCVFIVKEARESTEYTNGVITKKPSESPPTIRTYKLQNENGVWKIYDFKEGILTIDDSVWRSY